MRTDKAVQRRGNKVKDKRKRMEARDESRERLGIKGKVGREFFKWDRCWHKKPLCSTSRKEPWSGEDTKVSRWRNKEEEEKRAEHLWWLPCLVHLLPFSWQITLCLQDPSHYLSLMCEGCMGRERHVCHGIPQVPIKSIPWEWSKLFIQKSIQISGYFENHLILNKYIKCFCCSGKLYNRCVWHICMYEEIIPFTCCWNKYAIPTK